MHKLNSDVVVQNIYNHYEHGPLIVDTCPSHPDMFFEHLIPNYSTFAVLITSTSVGRLAIRFWRMAVGNLNFSAILCWNMSGPFSSSERKFYSIQRYPAFKFVATI